MSTLTITTNSATETQTLAETIGRVLRGGEVIELISDLGGGKTTFTKGLARGLSITDTVQSPTFTISRTYVARDNLELHHFDFYRLQEPGIMSATLNESMQQPDVIVVVEWGDIVRDVLSGKRLSLHITSTGEDSRLLVFNIPNDYQYIQKGLS